MKSSAHGTPCASKGARTVWGGAKDLKGSDLSPLLFMHEYSAQFLFKLWKRVRKYGAYCTGITQNVDDLLQSHTARTMLSNSEFIVMLNQAATDRVELAKLLNISDLQLSYITNVDAGHGLIKVGSNLVPFANKFPKNTKLYQLMTTKPGESLDIPQNHQNVSCGEQVQYQPRPVIKQEPQSMQLTAEEHEAIAKIHATCSSKEEFEAKAREYLRIHRNMQ